VALYHRAKIDGWRMRRPHRRRSRADLAKRLLGALELKMTRFENRMAESAASANAADSERDARTLNTLVRLFEKLKGLGLGEAATRRARPAKSAPAPADDSSVKDAHDADALRGELARRLEKLRGQLGG
jgi:DNA primase large subunit